MVQLDFWFALAGMQEVGWGNYTAAENDLGMCRWLHTSEVEHNRMRLAAAALPDAVGRLWSWLQRLLLFFAQEHLVSA